VKIAHQAGIPLVDAVYCASMQGAKILGNSQLGEVAAGKSADLLVTDADLNPMRVYKRGALAF
ncbi:amidohydrolase family protein, partial [uncultured Varibaculum sp.]